MKDISHLSASDKLFRLGIGLQMLADEPDTPPHVVEQLRSMLGQIGITLA